MKAYGDEALVTAVLADYRTAPIPEKLRAMLAFVDKLTVTPDELGEADIEALRAAGLDDAAITSAMYVAFMFNVIDRIANALEFKVNDARGLRWVGRILMGPGYGSAVVPG